MMRSKFFGLPTKHSSPWREKIHLPTKAKAPSAQPNNKPPRAPENPTPPSGALASSHSPQHKEEQREDRENSKCQSAFEIAEEGQRRERLQKGGPLLLFFLLVVLLGFAGAISSTEAAPANKKKRPVIPMQLRVLSKRTLISPHTGKAKIRVILQTKVPLTYLVRPFKIKSLRGLRSRSFLENKKKRRCRTKTKTCTQRHTLKLTPTTACRLNGTYTAQFFVRCRKLGRCKRPQKLTSANFRLTSANFCKTRLRQPRRPKTLP